MLDRQEGRAPQIVVGILRHPPLELDAAAALEEQPVPIRGERVQIGAPSTVAAAMGQDEAAELRIEADHHVASPSTTISRQRRGAAGLTWRRPGPIRNVV